MLFYRKYQNNFVDIIFVQMKSKENLEWKRKPTFIKSSYDE